MHPRVQTFVQAKNSEDSSIYYRYGIIDFLQDYTRKKKLETIYLRRRFKRKDPNCFSCVDPNTYGDRFYNFLALNLFTQSRDFPESELDKSTGKIGEESQGSDSK